MWCVGYRHFPLASMRFQNPEVSQKTLDAPCVLKSWKIWQSHRAANFTPRNKSVLGVQDLESAHPLGGGRLALPWHTVALAEHGHRLAKSPVETKNQKT